MQTSPKLFDELTELVIHNDAEIAIDRLVNYLKAFGGISVLQTVNMISARYFGLEKDINEGRVLRADSQVERAQINHALLNVIKDLKKRGDLMFPAASAGQPESHEIPELAFEKIIGAKSMLKKIAWLKTGLEKSKSICRIVNNGYGTGFLTSGGWVFTNHHVIGSADEAEKTEFQFNYEEDINGKLLQFHTYRCDPLTFFTHKELDFTKVRLMENQNSVPIETWKNLVISNQTPTLGDHVTIIQHPDGGPKQIALNENRVTNVFDQYLQYTTDTLPGSSGSPVFNDNWEVVAIHHAGGNLKTNDKGDKRFINEAVRMREIGKVSK